MLNFVLGRVKSGKTKYIIDEILKRRGEGTLFLVPEQYSHSMERLMCTWGGNTVSGYAEVTSFRRLSARVASELGGLSSVVVEGGRRILLLRRAIASVAPSLGLLKKTAARPERLPELLGAIDELKAYGVSAAQLESVLDDVSPACARKLSDLALIYAAYEGELSDEEFDAYDELTATAARLRDGRFWRGKTLYLDGFSGFTAAELEIIASAISHARDVYIALELPEVFEEGAENGIFDKAFETKKKIELLARRADANVSEVYLRREEASAIAQLDRALFSDGEMVFDGDAPEITIAAADGIFDECERCAAYILDRVREGARYRDFSVAVTSGADYLPIAERVFSRYGIPVHISAESDISSKPPVALVLSALDCILRNFKTDAVMEYIKTGFTGIRAKSLDIFENYLYTWAPRGSEWSSPDGFTRNPRGLSADETDETIEELRIINRVRKKIYAPIEKLRRALSAGRTGERCAEALYEFINDINLPRRISAYAYIEELRGRFSEAAEYSAVCDILFDAIDNLGRALGEDILDIEELFVLFKLVVSQGKLSAIPATLDCVNISDLSRAEGERCAYRIILGAEDGAFPKGADGGGIISDSDRAELSDFGLSLAPASDERIFEQYRTIHSVINSCERGLYLSYTTVGENNEQKQEAPIVSRLSRLYPRHSAGFTLREARLRAKRPCFDESISRGGLLSLWENDEEYSKKLAVRDGKYDEARGAISDPQNISAVFGNTIRLSASKADLFASCRYAYFLRYGLRLSERERAEISPIEAGTLMHHVLERVIAAAAEDGDYDEARALALADTVIEEYTAERLHGVSSFSGRADFMIKRLSMTVKKAISDICREMKKSEFSPREFELKFSEREGGLSPVRIDGEHATVLLQGAIDRVDTFSSGGRLYFRVIDYKSGKKDFSLEEAINGIGMQMLLYMSALEEKSEERFGAPAVGAGVMYVPIAEELSSGRAAVGSKKRKGVVLRDKDIIDAMESGEVKSYVPAALDKNGEISAKSSVLSAPQFAVLSAHLKGVLSDIGEELMRGKVSPNPYINGNNDACKYCEFKTVCVSSGEYDETEKRELIKIKMSELIERAGGEADGGGQMDN